MTINTKKLPLTLVHQDPIIITLESVVTIQNQSDSKIAFILDSRDQATRIAEGDGGAEYHMKSGKERTFSGFTGTITARKFSSRAKGYAVALIS